MTRHFFIGGKYYSFGSTDRDLAAWDRAAFHYFCPQCGRVWAEVMPDEPNHHEVIFEPCETHGSGSIYEQWVKWRNWSNENAAEYYGCHGFIKSIPLEVWKRELLIQMQKRSL